MSETRKLAAILAADVVGYSRLADVDEDRMLARLRAPTPIICIWERRWISRGQAAPQSGQPCSELLIYCSTTIRKFLPIRSPGRWPVTPATPKCWAPSTPPSCSTLPACALCFRNRYAEDELVQAIAGGIDGYVILGAGLDSFAYRRPDLMASLDVFEVDHPASQAWKRARVAELGIPAPARLHHVAIDFERTTLADGLAENGVDRGRQMFISMLGVAQYLTRGALARTLRDVAATTAPGSEMVMQYVVPLATFAGDEAALVKGLAARASTSQEPWLSFYEPAEMERVLFDAGFGDIGSNLPLFPIGLISPTQRIGVIRLQRSAYPRNCDVHGRDPQ